VCVRHFLSAFFLIPKKHPQAEYLKKMDQGRGGVGLYFFAGEEMKYILICKFTISFRKDPNVRTISVRQGRERTQPLSVKTKNKKIPGH